MHLAEMNMTGEKNPRNQISASQPREQKTAICHTDVSPVQSSVSVAMAPAHSSMGISGAGNISSALTGYKRAP